jgi:drug/metabolite transporter (DMT)-like permease
MVAGYLFLGRRFSPFYTWLEEVAIVVGVFWIVKKRGSDVNDLVCLLATVYQNASCPRPSYMIETFSFLKDRIPAGFVGNVFDNDDI